MEVKGKLIEKFAEQQVSEKFKKREFVIETSDGDEGQFTEQIKFQLVQDKTSLIDKFQVGDELNVAFNLKGNKWKDNYFVNLQAWKIDGEASSQGDDSPQDTDGLPF